MISLKPHDIVLALKIGCIGICRDKADYSISYFCDSLKLSRSEISKSLQRLHYLELIRIKAEGQKREYFLLVDNILAFLLSGMRHLFKPEPKGNSRGIPTGFSCSLIKSDMVPPETPLVWAYPGGSVNGEVVEPLYPGVPFAAQQDQVLYVLIALTDVIRIGKPREVTIAKSKLSTILKGLKQ